MRPVKEVSLFFKKEKLLTTELDVNSDIVRLGSLELELLDAEVGVLLGICRG